MVGSILAQIYQHTLELVRRARQLAWFGIGWHGVEAAVALGAGLAASSIALIGFEADSLIESLAGVILIWRFAASRAASQEAERRAQKLIALSLYLLAAYVGFESLRTLLAVERPEASWVGIGLAAVTLITMPPLAIAKGRIGEKLGSSATKSEGQQNMLCACLSAALLVGLGANALFGLWGADPATALLIAGVAVKKGYLQLACSLSGPQQTRRQEEVGNIFEGCLVGGLVAKATG
jgi:divalent metal cation (Fe/Co/Zn/Cd) transporter